MWREDDELMHVLDDLAIGAFQMSGKELFDLMVGQKLANPTAWANPQTQDLYTFIADLHGTFTAEELYEQVRGAGLFVNDMSFKERSPRFRTTYITLADVISGSKTYGIVPEHVTEAMLKGEAPAQKA